MQTEVKEIGPCKLSVKIEIPPEKIKEKLAGKYQEFINNTVIPGFRKGKAPRPLVERKFGKAIKEDTKMALISQAYQDVLKEKNLSPITEPVIEAEKIVLDENQSLAFEFTIEVQPQIILDRSKYIGLTIKKPKTEVNEADINQAVESLRQSRAELLPVKEKTEITQGDFVVIDQEIRSGTEIITKEENLTISIGPELVLFGKPAPEVVQALIGLTNGAVKMLEVTIPDNYKKTEWRGKKATLKITIKEVKRLKLPEVSDAWAKEMNFDSLEHLKEELKKRITEEKEHLAQRLMEDEIIGRLVREIDFALPEGIIQRGVEILQIRKGMMLHYNGVPEDKIAEELNKSRSEDRDAIIKDLKAYYILEHIARQEKILVTEDEVAERINEIASRQHKWPHEIKAYYEKNNLMGQLRSGLREEKVRKFLMENARITD